ncbi:peroxidase 2 [Brachypodium distachyon]|uniref:Peroxidase n=1 Tax=Brachypodium distachyon TaxID=15368 RepID=I1HM86_BRADI|nr:peroxidase 2 [Brachypodium distachyon]KQK07697.1 hypothetical protein BRADI_2g37090v3 [Brachypodium distachyon]|eukprot:XP_010233361.1 peroxidase 2 [Brachypodium distachyon]
MAKRNEKGPLSVLLALAIAVVLLAAQVKPAVGGGYTDPMQAEVRKIVGGRLYDAPGLIRLLFHDCWVQGCDGSVLLTETPYKSKDGKTEQDGPANIGLRGLDMIQAIKDKLYAHDNAVTCADAVVYAAREATYLLSNKQIIYDVAGPGSHRDGLVSSADKTNVLPGPTSGYDDLVKNFHDNGGLDHEDLVALSGAHGVGKAHLSTFADRFGPAADDEINHAYRDALKKRIPKEASDDALALHNLGLLSFNPAAKNDAAGKLKSNPTVENNVRDMDDVRSESGYDATGVSLAPKGALDNSYYTANLQNMVLFKSDWALTTNHTAKAKMVDYKKDAKAWYARFGKAMEKLSKLKDNNARYENEPRTNCSATNKKSY